MPPTPDPPGRVAAIDYGTVRIGIAISDSQRRIASPYESYTRRNPALDGGRFRRLVSEERIKLFIVGLPVHLDGHESGKSVEARRFGAWLTETTGIEVRYFDERYTTVQAEEVLREAQATKKRRKANVDQIAAQVLLAAFLESPDAAGDNPGGLDDAPRRRR